MLIIVAKVLAVLVGAGIIVVGLRQIWFPRGAAGFGIPGTPVDDPAFRSWLKVKSARDIASGAFVFLLMAVATSDVLGWFLLVAAGIPVGDALIVWRSKGPRWAYLGVHGATAAVMLVAAAILLVA